MSTYIRSIYTFIFAVAAISLSANSNLNQVNYKFYSQFRSAVQTPYEKISSPLSQGILHKESKFFAVKDNPFLQRFLDKAVLDITLSHTGKNICLLLGFDEKNISNQLGLSTKIAHYLNEKCNEKLRNVYDQSYLNQYKVHKSTKTTKSFYFVVGTHQKYPLDGWTSFDNNTFIFLNQLEPTLDLYKKIIHEIYVTFDQKLLLGNDDFNTIDTQRYQIKRRDQKDLHDILSILPFSLFRFTFLTMRSYKFEELIIRDLLQQVDTTPQKDTCWRDFERLALKLLSYQYLFLPLEHRILSEEENRKNYPHLFLSKKQLKVYLDFIKKKNISFKDKVLNKKVNFCEYITEPYMSTQNTFFSRGPRPRITGGWTGTSKTTNINHFLLQSPQNYQNLYLNDGDFSPFVNDYTFHYQTEKEWINEIVKQHGHINQTIRNGEPFYEFYNVAD